MRAANAEARGGNCNGRADVTVRMFFMIAGGENPELECAVSCKTQFYKTAL